MKKRYLAGMLFSLTLPAITPICSPADAQQSTSKFSTDYERLSAFYAQQQAAYYRRREEHRQTLANQPSVQGDIKLIRIILCPNLLGPLTASDFERANRAITRIMEAIYSGEPEATTWFNEHRDMIRKCKNICESALRTEVTNPISSNNELTPSRPKTGQINSAASFVRSQKGSSLFHQNNSSPQDSSTSRTSRLLQESPRNFPSPSQLGRGDPNAPLSRVGSFVVSKACSPISSPMGSFRRNNVKRQEDECAS